MLRATCQIALNLTTRKFLTNNIKMSAFQQIVINNERAQGLIDSLQGEVGTYLNRCFF